MRIYNKYLLTLLSLIVVIGILAYFNYIIKVNSLQSVMIGENERPKNMVYYDGDIVFQNSTNPNCVKMKKLTHCTWNQLGILFSRKNEWYVYEADDLVQYVRFSEWKDEGVEGRYIVKRLKNSDKILTDTVLRKMNTLAEEYSGREYDQFYSNDDQSMYNSELVYKMYLRAADVKLGQMMPLSNYDLTSPDVQNIIKVHFGDVVPKDSLIISPDEIFNSNLLYTVYSTE